MIDNIVRLHTTEMGAERIRRNLGLSEDSVEWCWSKIMDKEAIMNLKGKNWYVCIDGCVITVNAGNFTIITAHRETCVLLVRESISDDDMVSIKVNLEGIALDQGRDAPPAKPTYKNLKSRNSWNSEKKATQDIRTPWFER